MARVRVIEPRTGSVVEVDSDSPMAKKWESADKATTKKSPSSSSRKSNK